MYNADIIIRLSKRAYAEFCSVLTSSASWYDPRYNTPNRVFELSGGGGNLVVTIQDDRRLDMEYQVGQSPAPLSDPGRKPVTDAQIENWFTYHNDPSNQPKFDAINAAAIALAKVIRDNTPICADQTAAFRLVREARMTANAAIACKGL